MRDDRERLQDIVEAIERIEKYATTGRQRFERDELVQVWIVHHLQLIGEAARALSDEFRNSHPQLPWSQIIGMRNVLVHDYFGIDTDIVWAAIERDLPKLRAEIESILRA
jgi:uncharacterized protein with HEPN domain